MYDPDMRKDCPMRGNLGNCSPVGGFCMDAVSDEICEAVHNAYDRGFYNAVRTMKEHEAQIRFLEHQREKGHWIFGNTNGHSWMKCSQCGVSQDGQTACYSFCPNCGADMSEGR